MKAFIEAIIIFGVLFFRLPVNNIIPEGPVEFSINIHIIRFFYFTAPSLALIWYLLLKSKSLKEWGISTPKKQDFFAFIISLPALVLVSTTVFFVSSYLDNNSVSVPRLLPPHDIISWIILVFSCISSALLEESYFRFYLLSKHEDMKINSKTAVFMSTLLFSYCHIYEGPWGFLNSAMCGVVLAYVFLRFRSLYGLVFAHAAYNVMAYLIGAA